MLNVLLRSKLSELSRHNCGANDWLIGMVKVARNAQKTV